jgi:hypothetical protein
LQLPHCRLYHPQLVGRLVHVSRNLRQGALFLEPFQFLPLSLPPPLALLRLLILLVVVGPHNFIIRRRKGKKWDIKLWR